MKHTHTHTHNSRFKWRWRRLRPLGTVALSAVIGMAVAPERALADCTSSTCTGDEISSYSVRYHIIDLGDIGLNSLPTPTRWLPDPDDEGTVGLNELGAVVFAEGDGDDYEPWVWLPRNLYGLSEGRQSLPSIDHLDQSPANAIARDINDAGVIVGQSKASGSLTLPPFVGHSATIWYLDQTMGSYSTLSAFGSLNADGSGALAVSNTSPGVVVGTFRTDDDFQCTCSTFLEGNVHRAFAHTLGGSAVVYAPSDLDEAAHSHGRDISSNAQERVGFGTCSSTCAALPCTCNNIDCVAGTDLTAGARLASLDGSPTPANDAYGVNNDEQIVGRTHTCTASIKALFWDSSAACPCVLGDILPSGQEGDPSRAVSINNLVEPQVVGWNTELNTGLLWEYDDAEDEWLVTDIEQVIDEDDPDRWLRLRLQVINDKGWIAGWGTYCTLEPPGSSCTNALESHAFLLIPLEQMKQCDGDATGGTSAVVDVDDLMAALDNWMITCAEPGPPLCTGDANCDGTVDVFDLLEVLDNWGVCNTGTAPASLESLLVAAGLPSDADDDYLDILTNGTQAQIANYNCWVQHYLDGCGALCQYQCPDNDPWGHH